VTDIQKLYIEIQKGCFSDKVKEQNTLGLPETVVRDGTWCVQKKGLLKWMVELAKIAAIIVTEHDEKYSYVKTLV
jgi:hypothetical protein